VFLGCSNYPRCDGIVDLSLYADQFGAKGGDSATRVLVIN